MSSEKKMITLKSSDDEIFGVEEAVALESETIKHMIEDECANNIIPIPNVTSKILAKVIEYCKRHATAKDDNNNNNNNDDNTLKAFDSEFVKVDHRDILFDVLSAANYLNIKSLLDLAAQTVADMIKDESVEKIREIFNIKNDYTPQEEAVIRKDNEWAFQ